MKVVGLLMWAGCGTPSPVNAGWVTVDTSLVLKADRSAATYSLADATDRERQLFDAINTTRTSAGLSSLTWNSQIAFAAHHTPPGRALNLGHQPFGKISVDLATAPSVDVALQAWMKDGNQRAHLLDAAAKQIGVAVSVQPDDEVLASVVVLGVPARIDPIALDRRIENALETRWRRKDSDLHTTAQVVADLIARGATDQVQPELTTRLGSVATRFSLIYNSITRLQEPDRLEMGTVIGNQFAGDASVAYGVGVAQASEVDGGAIYLVAVYGRLGQ
jgi:hypothetical protein